MSGGYRTISHSAQHLKNTPIKTTPTRTAGPPMNAEEVKEVLKDELERGNYHVTPTEDFLTNLFPVDEGLIRDVYDELVTDKVYDEKMRRWKKLYNTKGKREDTVYRPFVETVESIRKAALRLVNEKPLLHTEWVDRHNEAPSSIVPESPLLRPDIINILQSQDEDIEERVHKTVKEDEKTKVIKAWWHRVNSVTEIKTKKNAVQHIYQLLVYMRQILAEQLDRRFVFGTLFCEGFLSAWLADRSGVLGTADAINVHREPRQFICVILAMSFLPPIQLGWDTTVKICKQPINPADLHTSYSFDPSVKLRDYNDSANNINWTIEMPSKDDPTKREIFVTVRALDLSRAGCMSGRATIVWAVLRLADLCKPPSMRKVYVLKQTWRPVTAVPEGEFYPKEGLNGTGLVHSYEDIMVDDTVINTRDFVRRGLKYTLPDAEKKRKNDTEDDPLAKYLDIITENKRQSIQVMHSTSPTWRIQSRTLMGFYGWPLRNFTDLIELLQVLKQVMEFHKKLYFTYFALHRDISINNILIYLNEDRETTEGRLIDYDYAKRAIAGKKPVMFGPSTNIEPVELQYSQLIFKKVLGLVPADNVICAISGQTSDIKTFVKLYGQTFRAEKVKECKSLPTYLNEGCPPQLEYSELGLLGPDDELPDFSIQKSQTSERSATFPYASDQILNHLSYITHEARHDMESFFWVLTEICISRKGPGGKRRDELCEEFHQDSPNAPLHLVYHYLFRCGDRATLIHNKLNLFQNDDFEEFVLCHVHPYFHPLKPLLLRWWNILQFLRTFPYIENVHDFFIEVIDDMLRILEAHQPSEQEEAESKLILDKRQEDLKRLRSLGVEDGAAGITWDPSPNSKNIPSKGNYTGPKPINLEPSSPTVVSKRIKHSK